MINDGPRCETGPVFYSARRNRLAGIRFFCLFAAPQSLGFEVFPERKN